MKPRTIDIETPKRSRLIDSDRHEHEDKAA